MPSQIDSRRRRRKLIGFIIAETSAVIVLLLAGTFVLAANLVDATVIKTMNVVMIGAAAAVAIIPILFFAVAPVMPRGPSGTENE
jgi:hypothetical protein